MRWIAHGAHHPSRYGRPGRAGRAEAHAPNTPPDAEVSARWVDAPTTRSSGPAALKRPRGLSRHGRALAGAWATWRKPLEDARGRSGRWAGGVALIEPTIGYTPRSTRTRRLHETAHDATPLSVEDPAVGPTNKGTKSEVRHSTHFRPCNVQTAFLSSRRGRCSPLQTRGPGTA